MTVQEPIAVTAGDPAGVGPELTVRLLAERDASSGPVLLVASREELAAGIERSGLDLAVDALLGSPGIELLDLGSGFPGVVATIGAPGGAWALRALEVAVGLLGDGRAAGLVFGPLNKRSLHEAGMAEPDELRWFENRLPHSGGVSEINVVEGVWTSRVTSHVSLREVPDLVTAERVAAAAMLLHDLLGRSGTARPRIAVCALNPHAGEGGLFGDEEQTAIAPGVTLARERGGDVHGPFPCDTLFRRAFGGEFDGVVTMHHDQGQIALKTVAFAGGVTLQAGLGHPVCTPAHGTAFDIVGHRTAQLDSTRNAYDLATRLLRAGNPRARPDRPRS